MNNGEEVRPWNRPELGLIFFSHFYYDIFIVRGDSLYIGQVTPPSLPLNPLTTPLKAVARGFFVLFHVSI
jgi:hypothetical protein